MANNDFKKITFSKNTYLIGDLLPKDKDMSFYESYFNEKEILNTPNVETRGGRGKTLLYTKDGLNLILRHYKRGGLFGKFVKDRFFKFELNSHRAIDEFKLLSLMRKMNLHVPNPVIAREKCGLLSYKSDIVIERLQGFRDLSYVIRERDLSDEEYVAIGTTIKRFFDNGIEHTDLNIRNILINDNCDVYLIDFDKCFSTSLTSNKKAKIVDRLLRSFTKECTKYQNETIHFDVEKFLKLRDTALA